MTDYTPTPDPRDNPHGYAYSFTNRDAAEYAAEYLDGLDSIEDATPDALADWAHETADGMAAVIYTGQAVALYAAGILDNEDDDAVAAHLDGIDHTDGAVQIIDRLVTGLAYEWHRRILAEAVEDAALDRRLAADNDDQAPEVTA